MKGTGSTQSNEQGVGPFFGVLCLLWIADSSRATPPCALIRFCDAPSIRDHPGDQAGIGGGGGGGGGKFGRNGKISD